MDRSSLEEKTHFYENRYGLSRVCRQSVSLSITQDKLSYSDCKKHLALPFKETKEAIFVAVCEPLNIKLENDLQFLFQKQVEFCYCPKQELLSWIDHHFHHEKDAASKLIETLKPQTNNIEDFSEIDLLDQSQEAAPAIRLLNFVIQEAVNQKASDIHFEPSKDKFYIRYRIDGVLQNRHTIPNEMRSHLISRLKVMAKLDIAEMRRPQDGRIKLKSGNKEIDFRVSTIPIAFGERLVLRILDKENLKLGFDQLGMDEKTLKDFSAMIHKSEGIILVTGPTGSGKTTTLYSAVQEVSSESLNIMTIEDPIEYKLPGIAQIGVAPKIDLTFAAGLRHILRQDPDIILIGEIRDLETAQIAIQSALTGHLVLTTLHTNDAPSAITRLVDMGIEPYLISSCVIGILAQRLLRKICPHCKSKYNVTIEEQNFFKLALGRKVYKGLGCESCFYSGYMGRVGIYELLSVKGGVKECLKQKIDSQVIKNSAVKEGFETLKDQGLKLVEQGITTLFEVQRVALGLEDC